MRDVNDDGTAFVKTCAAKWRPRIVNVALERGQRFVGLEGSNLLLTAGCNKASVDRVLKPLSYHSQGILRRSRTLLKGCRADHR